MVLIEAAILGGALSTRKGRKIGKKIINFPKTAVSKERELLSKGFDKNGQNFRRLMVG